MARCSFCGKPNTGVDKLVVGAGAYICNECVALSASIIDGSLNTPAGSDVPVWESLTDEEMLSRIPRVAAHIDQAEADLRAWAQELRRRSITWVRIGEALGITRQSAKERFSGEERRDLCQPACVRGRVRTRQTLTDADAAAATDPPITDSRSACPLLRHAPSPHRMSWSHHNASSVRAVVPLCPCVTAWIAAGGAAPLSQAAGAAAGAQGRGPR
ncbi:ClpX C4-type zinc finger protein [Streptomyces sp. NBC_00203]|uniref:ClpX C4-type zinc finger protein n=1 Tax=Streptomyces sp. NBC_00203 TaxID=2975680 RepID=UPI003867419A